jgi:hypothetical protein
MPPLPGRVTDMSTQQTCRLEASRPPALNITTEVPSHTFGSGHTPAASNAGASAQPGRLGGDRAAEVATRLV